MTKKNETRQVDQPVRVDLNEEQREAFANTKEYVECNARLEMVLNLLYCAKRKYEEIEKILAEGKDGYTLKGKLKTRLEGAMTNGKAVEKAFYQTFFPEDWQRRISEDNSLRLEQLLNQKVGYAVKDGMKMLEMTRIRKEMGKGCDTCRKFRTQDCTYSLLASDSRLEEMERDLGCRGWLSKH